MLLTLALLPAFSALPQTIPVGASDTLAPLARQWAQAYMRQHPDVTLQVSGGRTADTFAALRERKIKLALVPRLMRFQESEACAAALGQRPAEYKLGVSGLVVYVNADNPVKVLTYDELYGIFRGRHTNWKDVGGQDAPITLYGQTTNNALAELFVEEVLGGKELAGGLRVREGAKLFEALAQDKAGIGFGPLAEHAGARALGIKRAFSSTPVEPTADAITERTYPITRFLYCYLEPAANQGALRAWLDWVRGDDAQRVLKAAGFYPLPAKLRGAK
jgi:phosphate transport system substrate-binding protein